MKSIQQKNDNIQYVYNTPSRIIARCVTVLLNAGTTFSSNQLSLSLDDSYPKKISITGVNLLFPDGGNESLTPYSVSIPGLFDSISYNSTITIAPAYMQSGYIGNNFQIEWSNYKNINDGLTVYTSQLNTTVAAVIPANSYLVINLQFYY